MAKQYPEQTLIGIYELGRLYYEMGYFAPAERIFGGLVHVDEGKTPARLALGVIKLERNLFAEATNHFRLALQSGLFPLSAKLGLAASFVAQGDVSRARSLLAELERADDLIETESSGTRSLLAALSARVAS